MPEKQIKAVLAYEVNQQSLRNVQQSIEGTKRDLRSLDQVAAELGSTNSAARLQERFARLGGEIDTEIRSVRQLNQELAALDGKKVSTQVEVEATGDGQGRAGGRSRLGRFAVDLRNLPAVPIPGTGITSDAAAKLLNVVDIGLTALGPAAIAAGVAAGGLAFGLAEVSRRTEEATEAAQRFKEQIGGVFDIVASGGGSEEIGQRLEQAQSEQRSLEQQLAFNRNLFQQATDAATARLPNVDVKSPLGAIEFSNAANEEIQRITGGAVIDMSSLSAVIEQLEAEAKTATTTVGTYTLQLSSFEVALNDVAIAEEQANNDRISSAVRRSEAEAEAAKFAEDATTESARKRVEAAQDEINRLLDLNAELQTIGGDTAAALIEENNVRITEQQVILETTEAIRGLVGQRGLTDFFKGIQNGIAPLTDSVVDSFDSLITGVGKISNRIGEPIDDLNKKLSDAATKTGAAIDVIENRLTDQLASALEDRNNGLLDAQTKANDARESQEVAHQDRLKEIVRRANATISNAIASRDVLAAILAQQQKQEQLKSENISNKRRLAEIDKSLERQNELIKRRYDQQVDAARKAAEASIRVENEKLRALQQQLNAELQIAQQHYQARLNLDVAGWDASLQVAQSKWSQLIGIFNGSAYTPTPPPINPLIPTVVPYTGTATGTAQNQTVNNITVNTATDNKTVRALSNEEARDLLYDFLTN